MDDELFFQPVALQVVPPTLVLFAKHPKVGDYDLSSVKRIFCGAAPLSSEITVAVEKRLKPAVIVQGMLFCGADLSVQK